MVLNWNERLQYCWIVRHALATSEEEARKADEKEEDNSSSPEEAKAIFCCFGVCANTLLCFFGWGSSSSKGRVVKVVVQREREWFSTCGVD